MAVPHISVEGDLEKRHGKDFRGLGVRAVEFAAKPHGYAVDEESVKENIAHADEQDGVESAPGEDSREGRWRWLGRFRSRCGVRFRRAA